ncbi:MAG: TRAP transporter small permease [Christensenellales bacterium]|jgi:TRAP-type C4-dicarboxylate transport system permease small subunit
MIERIEEKLRKIFCNISGFFLAAILFFVILAVLDRTVLKIGFFWTEELARTCNIWFSMFTPAIMISEGTQFALDYFKDKWLKGKAHRIWSIVLSVLMLVASILLVVHGIEYMYAMRRQLMPTIGAPIALMYMALPFGMSCVSLMLIIYIIREIKNLVVSFRTGDKLKEGAAGIFGDFKNAQKGE